MREPIISLIPYNTQNCHSYLFLMVREFCIIHFHTITAVFVIHVCEACTAITKAGHKMYFAFIGVLTLCYVLLHDLREFSINNIFQVRIHNLFPNSLWHVLHTEIMGLTNRKRKAFRHSYYTLQKSAKTTGGEKERDSRKTMRVKSFVHINNSIL